MAGRKLRRFFFALAAGAVAYGAACDNPQDPTGTIPAPSELTVEAIGMTTVRVSWRAADDPEITGYEIQRRTDLRGRFEVIESGVPPDGAERVAYFDTRVQPDRYYGYRVRAVSRLGGHSTMSNVSGTKTAPPPGLRITTTTEFPNPVSADPDGYTAVIRGAHDTMSVALGINAERLVSPMERGSYSVALRGLANNCATTDLADTVKSAHVTDEGTHTVVGLSFIVSCRDPAKASIVAVLRTTGDTIDADGLAVTASGIIRAADTPAGERVFFETRTLTGANGAVRFDNLRPGDYEISISDIDSPCVKNGDIKKTLEPQALAVDTVAFAITCRKPEVPVDTVGRPFILRQQWSSATARPGDKVSLLTSLDLRAQPAQEAGGIQALISFDNSVVRRDSARTTGAFDLTTAALAQPGIIALLATNTDATGRSGDVPIVRTWFTVIGAVGSSVRTSTTITEALDRTLAPFTSKVRPQDATLTISANGAPANQSPTANVIGPTTGAVGASISFSGTQSSDTDGTIVSYAWTFGDNSSGTGATVSHTYATAGTFTVRLTVTDDRGATGTRDHVIVVATANPTTGTISGTVTSPQQGALSAVTVTVTGGLTATTSASGAYAIANVPAGSPSVSLSTLPAGCTAPVAQGVTVTAGATATAHFLVTCTPSATTGTVAGRMTRTGDGAGIANAQVLVQPAGAASALPAVMTTANGNYTVSNVPVGSGGTAGTGSITLAGLPSGCAIPGSQSYTGLTAGGTATKDIVVTCQTVTTGTVTGAITRSTGGALAGAQVTATPSGGAALAAVTTNGSGVYTIANVPPGNGAIALTGLPAGCTNPGAQTYTGVAAGGTVTTNVTVTCPAAAHTYPFMATWGAITNTGPTGRQVTLTLAIDMGTAPGRPDVDGANADPLAGVSFAVAYNGTLLDWLSRSLLSPDEFDLGVVNEVNAGQATAQVNGAIGSTGGQTKTGSIQLIRLTFNIATGASGTVTPTITISEALATTGLQNVTASVIVQNPPALIIP